MLPSSIPISGSCAARPSPSSPDTAGWSHRDRGTSRRPGLHTAGEPEQPRAHHPWLDDGAANPRHHGHRSSTNWRRASHRRVPGLVEVGRCGTADVWSARRVQRHVEQPRCVSSATTLRHPAFPRLARDLTGHALPEKATSSPLQLLPCRPVAAERRPPAAGSSGQARPRRHRPVLRASRRCGPHLGVLHSQRWGRRFHLAQSEVPPHVGP